MNHMNKAIATLELDKVLEMLADCAPTAGAADMARALRPSSDAETVEKRLRRTSDAQALLNVKGLPSFGEVIDPGDAAERASKGAVLTMRELLDVAALLRTARYLDEYYKANNTLETSLDEVFERLEPNKHLENEITKAILSEDIIADDASPTLADLRRKKRHMNNRIKEILQRYTSGSGAKYLQEPIVTMRAGRYVVPVKAEYRNEVKGLIHDTSASGATLFVEPMSVVESNNEIRALESKEQHEISRILASFSASVASMRESLNYNYRNITELAFAFGCAQLSLDMDAVAPRITEQRACFLYGARHPLLDKDTVVPVTILLDEETSILVVTGPNTGGKTVTLKTLGLFSMMVQCGLHIPVEEESSLCLFDAVYADIGDEQSIEQSLSTFSAHMVSIVSILGAMTDRSLVLFDELGAGTDPVEGAALAISILETVMARGALCAATTHYAELKAFALQTPRVKNASCEFDVQTLRPTYKLIIGTPGKSNAFAISRRLGLSDEIIRRADALIASENKNFEEVIEKLEIARADMEKERALAKDLRMEYEAYKRDAEERLRRQTEASAKETERAREEALRMVESAKATSRFIFEQMEELKKKQNAKNLGDEINATRRAVREHLKAHESEFDPVVQTDEDYTPPRPFKKGDEAFFTVIGKGCTLITEPDKNGNVTVAVGAVKTKTNVSKLRLVEKKQETEADRKNRLNNQYRTKVSRDFKIELDVRGETGEEAWLSVDKYLDEALVAGIKSVTIIHGKGTGALRNHLWQCFKRDARVSAFRAGMYGEGDYGVTVVDLK